MAIADRRAIFLDKDGTLVDDVPYNADPARITLAAGAADGVRALHAAGYRIVIVSNQGGVARGYFDEVALEAVQGRIEQLLAALGVPLAGFYYCPHHSEGRVPQYAIDCMCRKPEPGLIELASEEVDLDPAASWCIGDILDDVECGRRAGCHTALIANGNETEWRDRESPWRTPHIVAPNLAEAARSILRYGDDAALATLGRSSVR